MQVGLRVITLFRFSQFEVKDRHESFSGRKKKVKVKVIFQDLILAADFNKNPSGKTIVMPDLVQELFGELADEKLLSKFLPKPFHRIKS